MLRIVILSLTLFSFFFASNSFAVDKSVTNSSLGALSTVAAATPASIVPSPPALNSKAYFLIDYNSGKILAQKNANERRAPASLTKLMAMYVVSNAIKEGQITTNEKVRVSTKAWRTGGSRMFIRAGQMVPVVDLIKGVIVVSGNDACVALAQFVGGTEKNFVKMMNQQAKNLGMTESHFTDCNGLPHPDHYSSARDLAILARALIHDFPNDYKKWYDIKWFTWNNIKQPNRITLLWSDPTVDGMKTGHTKEAGYCLVASAKRHGMRLISVIMGTPSEAARNEESERLLNYGFRFYDTHKLYQAAQPLSKIRVWKGQTKNIQAGLKHTLYITIPKGEYKNVKADMTFQPGLEAPIKKGQKIGEVKITLNGKVVVNRPLLALQADPLGGLWTRITDSISMSFHKLFNKV